jgi:hypothetical protein
MVRHSKIDESDSVVFVFREQEILRFQIPMTDLLKVEIFDSFGDLYENIASLSLIKTSYLVYSIKQLSSLAETN